MIPHAELMDEATLTTLNQTLARGVLELNASDGQPVRIAIPRDFRILMCARWEPAGLPLSIPTLSAQCVLTRMRWRDGSPLPKRRVGPPR